MLKNLLTKTMQGHLDGAVHSELYAANLYRHLATKLQRLGFFGAQKHFIAESADEIEHYQKLADFMSDRGAIAGMPQIEAMDETVASLRDAIEIAFETELQLEKDYTRWYRAAMSEDPVTAQFLLGFLDIQRKSVGEYGDLLARLDRAGNNEAAILIIDQELGA